MSLVRKITQGIEKRYVVFTALSPLFMFGEVIMETTIPLVMAQIVDVGIKNADSDFVVRYGLLMVCMASFSLFSGAMCGRLSSLAAFGFSKNLRKKLFKKVQDFSFSNMDHFGTDSLVTRLTTDVTNLQNMYQNIIRTAVRSPIMLIFGTVMASRINARLALIFFIALPFLAAILITIVLVVYPRFREMLKKYDDLNRVVQENLIAIRVVKSFVRGEHENAKFDEIAESLQRTQVGAEKIVILNMPIMQLVVYGCIVSALWFGGNMILSGEMQVGGLISFISYVTQILMSLMMLSRLFVMFILSRTSLSRIMEILDEEIEIQNPQITQIYTDYKKGEGEGFLGSDPACGGKTCETGFERVSEQLCCEGAAAMASPFPPPPSPKGQCPLKSPRNPCMDARQKQRENFPKENSRANSEIHGGISDSDNAPIQSHGFHGFATDSESPNLKNPCDRNPCDKNPSDNFDIEFSHVSFSYDKKAEHAVLSDINLSIPEGSTVGILGGTGSSKSTLVQLVPRLYEATSGSVKVGGIDVREWNLTELRKKIGFVLQKNTLFSGTIAENLRWGNENATDEDLVEACKASDAHGFVLAFPAGYDTDLGQGGVNLSGGQKQRLCIARALVKKPAILILDDSTSAVDTATDLRIRAALRSSLPQTTKLIIAQRIASVQDADFIIVLDAGKINGIGTHDALMKENQIYRETYESQMSEN